MILFNRFSLMACGIMVALNACKPINSLTKIKDMPDEYTRNYCCGEVAVPKSAERGTPWIVYSDRNSNPTFHIPGGKLKLKEVSYFEPLAVINEEGDYVEVVKYEKGVFEGRRVKDVAKAEYLGWMPKSNLVLSSKPMTDVATGFAMKMITMINDTFPLSHPDKFFTDGEVTLYGEPELLNPIGTIPFQKPIFLSKRSVDKDKCLVIGVEDIMPEKASSVKSGWISSSMLRPLGEMLYCDFSRMPIKRFLFSNSNGGQSYSIPKASEHKFLKTYKLPDFVGLNPVWGMEEFDDNSVMVKTATPVALANDENNLIYSLAGNPITKSDYDDLSYNLRNINIMVVFSGQKEVDARFKQYVSYLQQLDGIIKHHSDDFRFRLGYYVGFDAENSEMSKSSPSDNISSVLLDLEKYADDTTRKVKYSVDAWSALRGGLSLLSPHREEQNIVIVIGENGNQKELIDDALVNSLVQTNCRIIGCQLISSKGNSFNNFVLQVEDMISRSADEMAKGKKNHLVHSEQLCAGNIYKEFSENVYGLDYPKNSMQQGWVIFPRKKETLSPDLLLSVTDSTISMVEHETNNVLSHLGESFKNSGVGRVSVSKNWLKLNGFPTSFQNLSNDFQTISSSNPVCNYPTKLRVEAKDLKRGKYLLFVTDSELNRIRQFMNELLAVRVDSRNIASNSQKKIKSRSCPDMETKRRVAIPEENRKYQNTTKARKSMYKTYLRWSQNDKVYPKKTSKLKRMTLSKNQQEAFSALSFNGFLFTTRLSALKSKRAVSDAQLDKFQEYLLTKQKALEDAINNDNKYEYNGQTYYAIDANMLP